MPGVYAGPIHGFLFGDAFEKGLTFAMGQTHVQKFLPELLAHIEAGKIAPQVIITHRLSLAEAATVTGSSRQGPGLPESHPGSVSVLNVIE